MASLELNAGTNFILVILIIGGINWLVTMLRLGTTYGFSGAEQAWASHPRDALSWIGDYIKKSGGSALASLSPQLIIYLIVGICAIVLCFTIAHAHVNSSKKESFGYVLVDQDKYSYCPAVADASIALYNYLEPQTKGGGCASQSSADSWLNEYTSGLTASEGCSVTCKLGNANTWCYNQGWPGASTSLAAEASRKLPGNLLNEVDGTGVVGGCG